MNKSCFFILLFSSLFLFSTACANDRSQANLTIQEQSAKIQVLEKNLFDANNKIILLEEENLSLVVKQDNTEKIKLYFEIKDWLDDATFRVNERVRQPFDADPIEMALIKANELKDNDLILGINALSKALELQDIPSLYEIWIQINLYISEAMVELSGAADTRDEEIDVLQPRDGKM